MTQNAVSIRSEERGFTLVELMLSIALVAVISGASSAVYFGVIYKNGLDIAATSLAQGLRRAQGLAQAGDSDTGWGVYIKSGSITLFKGATYATRDQTADDTASIAGNVTISGATETDFTKFTGDPTTTATYVLTANGNTKTITVNSKGMVNL